MLGELGRRPRRTGFQPVPLGQAGSLSYEGTAAASGIGGGAEPRSGKGRGGTGTVRAELVSRRLAGGVRGGGGCQSRGGAGMGGGCGPGGTARRRGAYRH